MNETDPGLLAGLKVLSFTHYLQGPAAAQYLADLGADVVKVESLSGAAERFLMGPGPGPDQASSLFVSTNRNVRSLAVDLKREEGRQVVLDLLPDFDVVVENFRAGVMDRLGLGYETLHALHPHLIYASASGYGASSPLGDQPGQDLLVQGLTGLVANTGDSGVAVGAAVVDQHGAALLALGIVAAAVRRSRTGEGCRVEGSLFNAGLDLQMEALTFFLNTERATFDQRLDRPRELATWYHPAPYGVYGTSDGKIVISQDPEGALPSLAPGLAGDPVRDRDEVSRRLAAHLAGVPTAKAIEMLREKGIWAAPVLSYDDVARHPQTESTGLIQSVGGESWEARVVLHPNRYDGQVPGVRRVPPQLGHDTSDVLRSAGFSDERIEALHTSQVVQSPPGPRAPDAGEELTEGPA